MVQSLITANPKEKRIARQDGTAILNVAEHFAKTVQGENFAGVPSSFLRLQFCTLACVWCDTLEVWKYGNPYSVGEILDLWEANGVVEDFRKGHHLVLTGGSPLKQQDALIELLNASVARFDLLPFVEVENECTLMPKPEFARLVKLWNNSPKLANSGMRKEIRYKPEVLESFKTRSNVYYKFVVTNEAEWKEIVEDFVDPGLIEKSQIVLMPEGQTRVQLQAHYDFVVDLCCREGLRMTDRMHVSIWDKKTGV